MEIIVFHHISASHAFTSDIKCARVVCFLADIVNLVILNDHIIAVCRYCRMRCAVNLVIRHSVPHTAVQSYRIIICFGKSGVIFKFTVFNICSSRRKRYSVPRAVHSHAAVCIMYIAVFHSVVFTACHIYCLRRRIRYFTAVNHDIFGIIQIKDSSAEYRKVNVFKIHITAFV